MLSPDLRVKEIKQDSAGMYNPSRPGHATAELADCGAPSMVFRLQEDSAATASATQQLLGSENHVPIKALNLPRSELCNNRQTQPCDSNNKDNYDIPPHSP